MDAALQQDLQKLHQAGTFKHLRYISSPMSTEVDMEKEGHVLVLSSNNYLGLADHPEVIQAGKDALDTYGAGTASVRFICGTFSIHRELEQALAKLHRTEAALTYPSCWQANTGAIPALTGEGDAIISDALNHASLIDGCRMSKAKRYVYKHADMADLKAKLEEAKTLNDGKGARRILVVTDGVFSMEGSIAPLPRIIELCREYGATLFMDDCHGVGAIGKQGRGTAEYFGVEGQIDIVSGTLGKALGGAAGGYIASSQTVIDYLNQVSRPQLFSNALPATVAGSALKAVQILEREPQRLDHLRGLVKQLREGLKSLGFKPLEGDSAIVPIIVGDTAFAIKMSEELLKEGIFITGFGFPVVLEGAARLRIQVCASLTEQQIAFALQKFEKVGKQLGVI
jgi:glycine C-acetyltransferase